MKRILKFLIILLPWFIGGIIFRSDTIFYKSINKPFFAPPSILFPIIWTLITRSMISGFIIDMVVLIPMITKTSAISPLYLNRYLNNRASVFALLVCSKCSSCLVALRDIFLTSFYI